MSGLKCHPAVNGHSGEGDRSKCVPAFYGRYMTHINYYTLIPIHKLLSGATQVPVMCSSRPGHCPGSSVGINYTGWHSFSSLCQDYLVTHDVTNTRNWSPINSSVWSLVITRRLLPVSTLIGHPGLGQASDWLVVTSLPVSCPQPRLPITRRHNAHISRHPGHSPHI